MTSASARHPQVRDHTGESGVGGSAHTRPRSRLTPPPTPRRSAQDVAQRHRESMPRTPVGPSAWDVLAERNKHGLRVTLGIARLGSPRRCAIVFTRPFKQAIKHTHVFIQNKVGVFHLQRGREHRFSFERTVVASGSALLTRLSTFGCLPHKVGRPHVTRTPEACLCPVRVQQILAG